MFHTFSRSHRNSWFHSQPLNESTVSRGVTDCFSDLCGSWGVTGCSLRLSGNLVMLHISHTESLVAASLFVDSMENPWWITHSHSQCSVCVHHSTGSKQVEILYWWISCCWINLVKAVVWLTVLKESVETMYDCFLTAVSADLVLEEAAVLVLVEAWPCFILHIQIHWWQTDLGKQHGKTDMENYILTQSMSVYVHVSTGRTQVEILKWWIWCFFYFFTLMEKRISVWKTTLDLT